MSIFSRREALRGFAALGLGATLPAAAVASPKPLRAHHSVSAHSFTIGEATVTVIRDTTFQLSLDQVVANAPDGAAAALFNEFGLPTDGVPTDVCQVVIDVGDVRVLVDTGTGTELVATMNALGMDPASVDRLLISHFHGDHVGAVSADGQPTFPNASVHIAAPELAFLDGFTGDSNSVANTLQTLAPVRDRLQPFADGAELAPGLRALAANGHTPGHAAFLLDDGGQRLLIAGDALVHPVTSFQHPEWAFGFDMDREAAAAARTRVLDLAVTEGYPLCAAHLPFPSTGYVGRDGDAYRFTPASL
ncbi:MAG: MBL fold metallo-hydrolase [Bacteroidota bacterium]